MLAASTVPRRALASLVQKAKYSAAAAAVQSHTAAAPAYGISTASNGVKIATVEDHGPTAALAIVVNGGARAEGAKNVGAAHFLKNFGFKNTTKRTALRITRETELLGGVLSSSLTRENLVYVAEFLKGDEEYFAEILSDIVTSTKFQEHEFPEVASQVSAETAYALSNPEVVVLDAAHTSAFRTGLGNSLFATPSSKLSPASVKAFAQEIFTSGNISLVATGVDGNVLFPLAESLQLAPGAAPKSASKYYGGETRVSADSDQGHYVVAFQGFASGDKNFAAAQVLKYVLGGEKFLPYGTGASVLAQTAAKFSKGTQISAFNLGYSDAGLFGVYVTAPNSEVSQAVAAATEQVSAAVKSITEQDYKRAVAQAKFVAATSFNTRVESLEALGSQAFIGGSYASPAELVATFDSVSGKDVANAAEQLLQSKPTTVAYGDLHNLPFADSLSI